MGVKKLVELFLEELSDRISTREIKNYFSAFGEVDLMENIYGRNSGLGIVEIKIDEQNKRKLLDLLPKINNRHFKVMFKEGIVGDDPARLDKRFGDNSSKLRLRGIRRDVTAHDIREFFGRRKAIDAFVEDENGFVEFADFETANKWNGANITVRGAVVKVYRSWKDSSRSKPVCRAAKRKHGRRGRDYSVSPIRETSRSRTRNYRR